MASSIKCYVVLPEKKKNTTKNNHKNEPQLTILSYKLIVSMDYKDVTESCQIWHNIGQECLDDILNSPKTSCLSSMSKIKDL